MIEINYCHSFRGDQNQSPTLIWWWVKGDLHHSFNGRIFPPLDWIGLDGEFSPLDGDRKWSPFIWCQLKGNFTIGWMDGWPKFSSSSIIWWNKIIVQFFHLKNQRFPLPKRWGSSLVSNNMSTRERNKKRLVCSLRQSNQINNIFYK